MANSPFILLDDQQVSMTLNGADDAGNPVALPSGVTAAWTLADPEGLLSITVSADTLSAVVAATGKLSTANPPAPAQVNVSVSGGGLAAPVTGSIQIMVNASALASISIVPGTPAHK